MNFQDFTAGLDILKKYVTKECCYNMGAEHDQFYVYGTDLPVSSSDCDDLLRLGWFQPNHETTYDQEYSWSAFV